MTQDEFIRDIAQHARKLADLMEHPEPGLTSWAGFVAEHAQFIADWWCGKMAGTVEDNR